jgi:hydroxypyruvate reductase
MKPHEIIDAVRRATIAAVEPGAAIRRHVELSGDRLRIEDTDYDLSAIERVIVLGAGKPAVPMVSALVDVLGPRIDDGLVITKHGHGEADGRIGPIEIAGGGHPVPDRAGTAAARRIADLARALDEHDLLIALIGGGASALLTLPAEGLDLDDMGQTTEALLRSGADIVELNAVRKHLSAVKGGQLARLAAPARTVGLVLSDVVGDPLDAIGSGPTAPDPTRFADSWRVVDKHALQDQLPPAVIERLRRGNAGEIEDTPTLGDPLFDRVQNTIIGGNRQAAQAAAEEAQRLGLKAEVVTTSLTGEAREVGARVAAMIREVAERDRPLPRPVCLVLGGETTVTVTGDGRGGRNQELALGAALEIDGLADIAVMSLATDGQDGPTDAAGAIAFGDTIARARQLGLDAAAHLANNDSYAFFDALGDLIHTGPTLTNVADVVAVFAF